MRVFNVWVTLLTGASEPNLIVNLVREGFSVGASNSEGGSLLVGGESSAVAGYVLETNLPKHALLNVSSLLEILHTLLSKESTMYHSVIVTEHLGSSTATAWSASNIIYPKADAPAPTLHEPTTRFNKEDVVPDEKAS